MKGDRYLLTGASGFLGMTIRETLSRDNDIVTVGRSEDSDYVADLSKSIPAFTESFDIVVHNAGKAHVVPRTDAQRKAFEEVNVTGTRNLLRGLEGLKEKPRAFVFISSIAVYGLTSGESISEDHPLRANDPYGRTKIQAETIIREWCSRHGVSPTILRLPLVAGKNPPGNLGAMISGMRKGLYVSIAGGKARKSIVLADDVALFIPTAAKHPGTYNLTDGYHPAFYELELLIANQASVKRPIDIPCWLARALGAGGDLIDKIIPEKSPVTSGKVKKLVSSLTFDDTPARRIGWQPRQVLKHFKIS